MKGPQAALGYIVIDVCPAFDGRLYSFPVLLFSQIGVTVALLTTVVGVISINETWQHEWDIIPISLQVS